MSLTNTVHKEEKFSEINDHYRFLVWSQIQKISKVTEIDYVSEKVDKCSARLTKMKLRIHIPCDDSVTSNPNAILLCKLHVLTKKGTTKLLSK